MIIIIIIIIIGNSIIMSRKFLSFVPILVGRTGPTLHGSFGQGIEVLVAINTANVTWS